MEKFIRYKDHKILYSEDNWKTIRELNKVAKSSEEERSKDVTTKVKLRFLLGEAKGKIIIDELIKIRNQYSLPEEDGFGHAFEIFAISVLYNIDYDVAVNNYIVNGNKDGKIDAIYWNQPDKNIVYQIKIDTLDPKEINIDKVMKQNYLSYIKTGKIAYPESDDLLAFCDKNKKHLTKDKDMDIVIISNNDMSDMNISPLDIFNQYFYNILICRKNDIELSLTIPLGNKVANLADRNDIYAYFVDAKTFINDLLNCENINIKDNLYKFFYDNVRGDLGSNDNIHQTINEEPFNFVKYNNGVTITGNVKYMNGSESIKIKNPIINNGQQTIWNIVNDYPNIDDVSLLIIVKDEESNYVKSKISRYTNSQRNIKPADLLSLNENLRYIQEQIFKLTLMGNSMFLEINSSGARNYNKILKKLYSPYDIISLTDFCKLYFSVEDLKLGNWKSSISTKLKEVIDRDPEFDVEKSLLVCNIISKSKKYIYDISDSNKRNDLKSADLAFMYIMYKYKIDLDQASEVICYINNKYYYSVPDNQRVSKLIDLYKSNSIIDKINESINELKINDYKRETSNLHHTI